MFKCRNRLSAISSTRFTQKLYYNSDNGTASYNATSAACPEKRKAKVLHGVIYEKGQAGVKTSYG